MSQSTDTVLMISPDHFRFNDQTAETNAFQRFEQSRTNSGVLAMEEFNLLTQILEDNGVSVIKMSSRPDVETPDAVFPNNWFSVHASEISDSLTLVMYPMLTANRQLERQIELLKSSLSARGFKLGEMLDLTHWETHGRALEGTGSMVLDRQNKLAYAAISPRMDVEILTEYCDRMGYRALTFTSATEAGVVYHTNVMMSVGTGFAVVCIESLINTVEANSVIESLTCAGKEIIPISIAQMSNMCGNILELRSTTGEIIIAMSSRAFAAYSAEPTLVNALSKFGRIIHVPIPTIEDLGGGSVRCMLAEIFH